MKKSTYKLFRDYDVELSLHDQYFYLKIHKKPEYDTIQIYRYLILFLSFFVAVPFVVISRFSPFSFIIYGAFIVLVLLPDILSKFQDNDEEPRVLVWESKKYRTGPDSGIITVGVLVANSKSDKDKSFREIKNKNEMIVDSYERLTFFYRSKAKPDYQIVIPVALYSNNKIKSLIPWIYHAYKFEKIKETPVPYIVMMGVMFNTQALCREIREEYDLVSNYQYQIPGGIITTSEKFKYKEIEE